MVILISSYVLSAKPTGKNTELSSARPIMRGLSIHKTPGREVSPLLENQPAEDTKTSPIALRIANVLSNPISVAYIGHLIIEIDFETLSTQWA